MNPRQQVGFSFSFKEGRYFCRVRSWLIILGLSGVWAQVEDDFSDGDFTANPAWTGETARWTIDGFMLRSNGPSATDSSYLSVPNALMDDVEWRFWVRIAFNPSTSNFIHVYLVSDRANLKDPDLNGYYLRLGGMSGSTDSLELYRQQGGRVFRLGGGVHGRLGGNDNTLWIRVIRRSTGRWEVYSRTGANWESEFTAADNSITSTSHFGVYFRFTPSRRDQLWFDNFYIGPILADNPPVQLVSAEVLSPTQVRLGFSGTLSSASATNVSNYSFGSAPIGIATVAHPIRTLVELTLSSPLQPSTIYRLSYTLQDANGNPVQGQAQLVLPEAPQPGDLIISEIMADIFPPPSGLPPYEYIELYNRSNKWLRLQGLRYCDAFNCGSVGKYILPPRQYVILVQMEAATAYAAQDPSVAHTPLSFWPYPSDSEDSLTILIGSTILDKVKYNYTWYRDYNKSFGGWSLERIDLDNLCARDSNWIASRDPRGGTPGRTNSVAGIWRDQYPPGLMAMRFPSPSQIELLFSETLDTTYMKDPSRYTLSGGLSVSSASVKSEREMLLQLSAPLASGTSYSIEIDAKDCIGNRGGIQRNFGLPEPAQPYDVVFTEIMADPFPQVGLPGYEYIEIHNRTNKFISLQGWKLVVGFSSVDSLPFILLPPQGYLVFTSVGGARDLQLYGYSNVVGLSYFPGVPNQGAALRLESAARQVMDRVTYHESWYRDVNKQFGGWSLERIWIDWACGEAANWKASESPRGGTPGMPNAFRPTSPPPAPSIVQLYYQHPVITLRFSERLDTALLADITRYQTEPALPFVGVKSIDGGAGVELVPMIPLEEGRVYQLTLTGLRSCRGDTVPFLRGEFFMVSPVQPGDVVINEILANTEIGGSRYVELYNRSRKIIDISQLMLAKGKDKYSFAEIASAPVYLRPGEHIALAYDTADVRSRYQPPAEARLWAMGYFPSYYYRGDTVWLLRLGDTAVIDVAPYVPEWHFSDLRNQRGVALERLSPDRPSFERTNWYSASSKVRYGTPGYRNSQRELQLGEEEEVRIEPKTIFPDGDGHKDFAWIYVPTQQPDTRVDITIYTLNGHIVRRLVQAHLLAVGENAFRWEGADDEGKRLPSGIYIVEVKISQPTQGKAQQYRLACALAEKP